MKLKSRIVSVVAAGNGTNRASKYFLSAEAMSFRVLNGGGSAQSSAGPDIDSVLAEAADDDVPF